MAKLLPRILPRTADEREAQSYREYMRNIAKMGGQLFGVLPKGHRREFFCLDEHTWVWHEEWIDAKGQTQSVTTRYDIGPHSVLKSQGHNSYQEVRGVELQNLYQATIMYCDNLVARQRKLQTQM